MSKPLAAKGVGACCFSDMFSTPGFRPGSSRKEETGDGFDSVGATVFWSLYRYAPLRPSRGSHSVTRLVRRDSTIDAPSATRPSSSVALDMLYRNEQRALVRFFTRYRASPDEAHDLAQETFLRMARAEATGGGMILRPAQYLRHIARNLLKDRARAAQRQSADAHVDAANVNLPGADELARLEARDSLGRLDAAMALLKPRTREIFMARHVKGLSHAEIAARTGLSVSGVEKQIALAFEQIHRLTGLP